MTQPFRLTTEEKEHMWAGRYWGPDGVLAQVRPRYGESDDSNESLADMLCVEYSAASRAASDLVSGSLSERLRAPLRLLDSGLRARQLARAVAPRLSIHDSVDRIEAVTAALIRLRERKLARQVLDRIGWYELVRRSYESPHTQGFLTAHAIACGLTELSNENLARMQHYALMTEQRSDYRQAVRLWRLIYKLTIKFGRREACLERLKPNKLPELERHLAYCQERADSADQVAKAS